MINEPSVSTKADDLSPRRPFSVTFLIVVVLIFTSLNVFRMITAIRTWEFLSVLLPDVSIIYLVITGAIWSMVGFPLSIGLFSGRKWSLPMTRIAVILYISYYWVDRLMVAERSAIASRWPFVSGLTILLLVLTFWILGRPKTKEFLIK